MRALALAAFISCIGVLGINAQEIPEMDKSPLDMAVFRPDGQKAAPAARIIYSRPQVKSRKIFGELVPYDKVWRTGANQTTELTLYRELTIEGNKLAAGNYTLYTIPGEKEWTIIISSKLFTWGAYEYDESKDVMRFKVPSKQVKAVQENFGIAFGGADGKGKILIAWENTEVNIGLEY